MHDEDAREPLRSRVRMRAPVRVMLVRVDPSCEPEELAHVAVVVLRVRHPIPACERMLVTRPELVLVGEKVRDADFVALEAAAARIGAELFAIGGYCSLDFATWLRGALRRVLVRRGNESAGA